MIHIVVFISLLCIVLSLAQYERCRSMLYSRYESYIENVLNYAAGEIDNDDLKACMDSGRESVRFQQLQQTLDNIRERTDLHFIYVVVPLNTDERDNLRNVIAGVSPWEYANMADQLVQLNQLTGDAYSPQAAKLYQDAYNSGSLSFFENRTQFGDDYTGLLPLYDSKGVKFAALCVDVEVQDIHAALGSSTITTAAIILLLGALFAAAFYRWTVRSITQPIEQLEESVVRFTSDCRHQKNPDALKLDMPTVHTANEVESLSLAVAKMGAAMVDYVKSIVLTESELARMVVLANKDPLTNVRNKNAYDAYAIELQSKMRGGGAQFGLLVADLNNLKVINDRYGHEKGDVYLTLCCHILCQIYDHSPVFRVGGDEFIIVLIGRDYENREALLAQARSRFHALSVQENLRPWERCSVAIGMAEYQEAADRTLEEIAIRADQNMYLEKQRMKSALEGPGDASSPALP